MEKEITKKYAYVHEEPVRWGVETGVMIGGSSWCQADVIPPKKYCAMHERLVK